MNNDREALSHLVSILREVYNALCEPVGNSFDEYRLGAELHAIESYLATPRPKIVCLCGSTKFKRQYEEANRQETLAGNVVLSVGFFNHTDSLAITEEIKLCADALHFRKIDLADEILVIDNGGYIGESTANEIAYAQKLGKRIRYWSQES